MAIRIISYLPIPILLLCCYFFSFYEIWDDDILLSAYVYNATTFPSLDTILLELFKYHNEHILLVVKLLFLIVYLGLGFLHLKLITYLTVLANLTLYYFSIKTLKLDHYQKIIISFGLLFPVFYDLYYWALSIQNTLVNLFVFLCWHSFLQKKHTRANIYYIAALFSSAQSIVFLPIWIAIGTVKKTNFRVFVLPILLTTWLKFNASQSENPLFQNSILANLNYEKIKSAYLAFCAPFNFHFTIYQFVLSTLIIITLGLVIVDYLKKLIRQKTSLREDFLMGLILYSLGCFIASIIVRQVTEIRYLFYSCIYVTFSIIYLTDKYRSVGLLRFSAFIMIVNYIIVLYATVEILPNIYIEKIIRSENITRNHHANFFPTNVIREQSEKLSNKKDFLDKPKFEIPNGINGSIPEHLYIFNEFIGYARNMIYLPSPEEYILKPKQTKIIKKYFVENKDSGKITEVLNLSIPKTHLNKFYKVIISSPHKQYDYSFSANNLNEISENYNLIIYSNQLPYGKFEVKIVEFCLNYDFK